MAPTGTMMTAAGAAAVEDYTVNIQVLCKLLLSSAEEPQAAIVACILGDYIASITENSRRIKACDSVKQRLARLLTNPSPSLARALTNLLVVVIPQRPALRINYLLDVAGTHLLTHSLTYSLTYSPTHSLTHLLTHLLTHSPTHLLTYSLTHLLTHLLVGNIKDCASDMQSRHEDENCLLAFEMLDGKKSGYYCLLTHSLTHLLTTYSLTHSPVN